MIMWSGQTYPIYNLKPPAGMYGHVEPVIGIQSNHPLNDSAVYDDDVVVHYTDGGVKAVYRPISSLPGTWGGVGEKADCGDYHCKPPAPLPTSRHPPLRGIPAECTCGAAAQTVSATLTASAGR
jgi:hypothetical protein